MKSYNVAILGATGAVGQTMIKVLEERNFPVNEIKFLASERSAGKEVEYYGMKYKVEAVCEEAFENVDIALFSAGGERSKKWVPIAASKGAVVIDNSSAFRMDPEVPLVVPEVNPEDVKWHKGIIANPNCSTIQMVVALYPIHKVKKIKRIIVATYQAVSGAGATAIEDLELETKAVMEGKYFYPRALPHHIAFNVIPRIDNFEPNGYTKEELKMINETRKIMHEPDIKVSPTCVRVPVYVGHSEAVTIETQEPITAEEAREILKNAPGVVVEDDPFNNVYPTPIEVAGKDDVFVGRIRKDLGFENGLSMWIVGDNLRKGAATNAVQIAELLVKYELL
ncbi:MAG TPA: aspartate-semialdehyde dehydrogenase [Sulfurihydrogenibium sp.]|uniref:aspartate-semialdehyde dehydrogenase n=1 Tax=Sulfurihydrogenibium sp. (strain YO3AOP1) TaxID=436114 RepID=UPI00017239D5|nr:aspartate-semialdehyde dehydrogenase [Sulfurihydrogenibium sp. YO3AOP1]ACD66323.1 aspartate-semialdehyde dehydrogenase [Sulfurihydrogenibium sp. YO3AOP1]HBT99343.1 aspartate-semialdehyde dehydrogenase [Sulfurihydrogenibium sp.]